MVLAQFGVTIEDVARESNVDPATLRDPNGRLAFASVGRIAIACVTLTGIDDICFRMGMQMPASGLGLVGLAALNAPTLGAAVKLLETHLAVTINGLRVLCAPRGDSVAVTVVHLDPDLKGVQQSRDYSLAALLNVFRGLHSPAWAPVLVTMMRPRPKERRIIDGFARCAIDYNAPLNSIVIDRRDFDHPVPNANPEHFEVLQSALEHGVASVRPSLREELRALLRMQIASGPLSLGRAAEHMRLSARTLERRVEQAGFTFAQLRDEATLQAARELLQTEMQIGEIASVLGYSETAAFTRSFKRLSGRTPRAFRHGPNPRESDAHGADASV